MEYTPSEATMTTNSGETMPTNSGPEAPAPEAHTFLDMPSRFRPAIQEFATEIGRNVAAYNPHRSTGMDVSTFQALRDNARAAGVDNPFLVIFFSHPRLRHSRSSQIDGGTYVTDDYGDVMFDAYDATLLLEGAYQDQIEEYGEMIESPFLEDLDAEWLFRIRNPGDRDLGLNSPVSGYVFHLFEDVVFIPWDLPHTHDGVGPIQHALTQVADAFAHLSGVPAEERQAERARRRAEREERQHRERLERVEREIANWAESLASRHQIDADRQREEAEDGLRTARQMYLQAVERARVSHVNAEAARRLKAQVEPADVAGLRGMIEQGTITDITFQDAAKFEFTTRPLYAQDDRTSAYHRIGPMRISINMSSGDVRFQNREFPDGPDGDLQMQAPHVFANGRPCMGNFAEMVADFVSEKDWFGFIQGAIMFAESVNTEDIGDQVHHWPFVSDPEAVGLPPYDGDVEPFRVQDEEDHDDDDYDDEIYEPADFPPDDDEEAE